MMGLKLLSSSLIRPRWWSSARRVEGEGNYCNFNRWAGGRGRRNCAVVQAFLNLEEAISHSAASVGQGPHLHHLPPPSPPVFILADSLEVGYSQASYYTSLGLFIVSVPGLWSLIKRSVKSKIVQKTFTTKQGEGYSPVRPNQMAGEILSFFTRNNFAVLGRGDTIT